MFTSIIRMLLLDRCKESPKPFEIFYDRRYELHLHIPAIRDCRIALAKRVYRCYNQWPDGLHQHARNADDDYFFPGHLRGLLAAVLLVV